MKLSKCKQYRLILANSNPIHVLLFLFKGRMHVTVQGDLNFTMPENFAQNLHIEAKPDAIRRKHMPQRVKMN